MDDGENQVGEVGQIAERSWDGGPDIVYWMPKTGTSITEEMSEEEELPKPYFEEFYEKNAGKVIYGASQARVAYDQNQN